MNFSEKRSNERESKHAAITYANIHESNPAAPRLLPGISPLSFWRTSWKERDSTVTINRSGIRRHLAPSSGSLAYFVRPRKERRKYFHTLFQSTQRQQRLEIDRKTHQVLYQEKIARHHSSKLRHFLDL